MPPLLYLPQSPADVEINDYKVQSTQLCDEKGEEVPEQHAQQQPTQEHQQPPPQQPTRENQQHALQ
jgi:hypothetical protein